MGVSRDEMKAGLLAADQVIRELREQREAYEQERTINEAYIAKLENEIKEAVHLMREMSLTQCECLCIACTDIGHQVAEFLDKMEGNDGTG